MEKIRHSQVVRFDFYAELPNVYENRYFSFVVNYPNQYQVFVVNTFYKFRRNRNKIKAMFLVYGNGYSEKITGEKFAEILKEYKQITALYRQEKEQMLFINSITDEMKRKGYHL